MRREIKSWKRVVLQGGVPVVGDVKLWREIEVRPAKKLGGQELAVHRGMATTVPADLLGPGKSKKWGPRKRGAQGFQKRRRISAARMGGKFLPGSAPLLG